MPYELAFEYLAIGLEATRGTAINPPTHRLPLKGTITPREERFYPETSTGMLAANTQSVTVKRWAEWQGSGGLEQIAAVVLETDGSLSVIPRDKMGSGSALDAVKGA